MEQTATLHSPVTDELREQIVNSVVNSGKNLIDIDTIDVMTVIRNAQNILELNFTGETVTQCIEALAKYSGYPLATSSRILAQFEFSRVANPTMDEFQKFSEVIQKLPEDIDVIWGIKISEDPEPGASLQIIAANISI